MISWSHHVRTVQNDKWAVIAHARNIKRSNSGMRNVKQQLQRIKLHCLVNTTFHSAQVSVIDIGAGDKLSVDYYIDI